MFLTRLLARRVVIILCAATATVGGGAILHEAVRSQSAVAVSRGDATATAAERQQRRGTRSWREATGAPWSGPSTSTAPTTPTTAAQSQQAPEAGTGNSTSTGTGTGAGTSATPGRSGPTPSARSSGSPTATAGAATPNAPSAPPVLPSSGSAVPAQDLPGWRLVLAEDFTRDAPLGSFAGTYRGWAGYDGGRDTSGNGTYDSGAVTSVAGGVLDHYLHGGQVSALTPQMSPQLYGRYSLRFRADSIPGYKIAWLLWPQSENWSQGGIEFPEADLDGRIGGLAHDVTPDPSRNAWAVDTGVGMADGHTATIEWLPHRITFVLDGQTWTTTDPTAIPSNPMRWVLQCETALDGRTPTGSGRISIDWVAAWARA